jgi:hypothetical protein
MSFSGLSGEHSTLSEVVDYKLSLEKAISYYYDNAEHFEEFALGKPEEIKEEKKKRLQELELQVTLWLLTAMEAWMRLDFEVRVRGKYKDMLSRKFREFYREQEEQTKRKGLKDVKIRLEDILDIWRDVSGEKVFSRIKELMNYRHWLAHGKYWHFKKRRFSFDEVYAVAEILDELLQSYSQRETYRIISKMK